VANNLITPDKVVASSLFREGDYTFDEFLALVEDGQKADLLNGVIYMASPDNTDAGDLSIWLIVVLGGYAAAKDLGKVFASRVAFRIGLKQGPEPDLAFVPNALLATRRRGYFAGPPMLVIEIVSPDSVSRDYFLKRTIYEQAGVREYWIIDPDDQRVTFLFLRKGHYQEVATVNHIIHSKVVRGFHLDVRWLLSEAARPEPHKVLQGLLKRRKR
jgi:Uma2 family endonuclease